MTNEIRTKFRTKIANITINRRKSKESLRDLHRKNGDYYDLVNLSKEDYYVSRWDARHTLLAYGYLKGNTYEDMEQTCREEASANLIATIALADRDVIASWLRGE